MIGSAVQQSMSHRKAYTRDDGAQRLKDREAVENGEFIAHDATRFFASDAVGEVVADYGEFGTKIESLAQLRRIPGYRAELAMLSLGRAYVSRCRELGGQWTSGLHLLWWTRQRLKEDPTPAVAAADFRYQSAASLARQIEIAQWRLVMLRLIFVSDIGSHAQGDHHRIEELADLAERSAEAVGTIDIKKLARWVQNTGLKEIEAALTDQDYRQLSDSLRPKN